MGRTLCSVLSSVHTQCDGGDDRRVLSGDRGRHKCFLNRTRGHSQQASAGIARTTTLTHSHERAQIEHRAHTRTGRAARQFADHERVRRRRALFIDRERGAPTALGRYAADRGNEIHRGVSHHNLDCHTVAALGTRAHNGEPVLRVHDEHVCIETGEHSSASDVGEVVDGDVGLITALLPRARDTAAEVARHNIRGAAARVVAARHAHTVLDHIVPDLARVRRVALARIVTHAQQRTALAVGYHALDVEFAEGAARIARTIQLGDIHAIDVRALTRQITIAVQRGADHRVAHDLNVLHAEARRVTVADDAVAVGAADHLSAQTTIEIVRAADVATRIRQLCHAHSGTLVGVVAGGGSAVLAVGAGLADLLPIRMWRVDHVLRADSRKPQQSRRGNGQRGHF